MTPEKMLRELGYDASKIDEIKRFQREHNNLNPSPRVLVNGKLDGPTKDAIRLAYSSKAMFLVARGQKVW